MEMPCLFRVFTGLYCPGCGGTRAVRALLAGHPVKSFCYHPLVPYCGLLALIFAVSRLLYYLTKKPGFRLPWNDGYAYGGIGIIVLNFLVKNYFLAVKGVDLLAVLL